MAWNRRPPAAIVPALAARASNAAARVRNAVASALPGDRPAWLVLELRGSYPARRAKRRLVSLRTIVGGKPEPTQEELADQVTRLLDAPWLEGVVLRFAELQVDLVTAYALRNQIQRLRTGGLRVVVTSSDLNDRTYYLASAADEVIAPEGAGVEVRGLVLGTAFLGRALDRLGIRFQKLAIDEFKNAGDQLIRQEMSEPQRLQYDRLLDSVLSHSLTEIAASRGRSPTQVRGWIDAGISSARVASEEGMIDRVAYEDEVLGDRHRPFAVGARFLPARVRPAARGRVAVVSLAGTIVPGPSRRWPVPVPILGDAMAGSETLVRALRAAGNDPATKAVVFHVDSGGGSAVASDLIWREVTLLARRMPVIAVMGSAAASGGYYVLTHATRVLAAPATVTGSIGVFAAKFVFQEFHRRHGVDPEALQRGRFAGMDRADRPWDDAEEARVRRRNQEIYDRFVVRVAEGRKLSRERVHAIGRGRIWSGTDAIDVGLIDALGDVQQAIAEAKRAADLPEDAPAWNVHAPQTLQLPPTADGDALLGALASLRREGSLLMDPAAWRLG